MRRFTVLVALVLGACSLYGKSSSSISGNPLPDAGKVHNDGGGWCDGGPCYLPDGGIEDAGEYLPDGGHLPDGGGWLPDGGGWLPDAYVTADGGSYLPDAH